MASVICTLCALLMSVSLFRTLLADGSSALVQLSTAGEWMLRIVNVFCFVTLAAVAYRAIAYVIECLQLDDGVYYLYSMIVSESLMVVLVMFMFALMRRFLNCLSDSAASIAYTLATGKLDGNTIPGFTATGFLILAIGCGLLAADRLFTLTMVQNSLRSYYQILVASHPLLLLSGGGFAFAAIANFLLAIFLYMYKNKTERMLFGIRKEETKTSEL